MSDTPASETPAAPVLDIPASDIPADGSGPENPFARIDAQTPPGPPPAPEKRGPGRPKGSKNKPKNADDIIGPELPMPTSGAADANPPKPRVDTAPEPTSRAKMAEAAIREVLVDPKRTAHTVATFIDGGMVALMKARHGEQAGAIVKATDEEKLEVEAALILVLQSAGVKMTPMQNFGMTMLGVYALKVVPIEIAAFKAKRGK